jgi:hypothetical protein
VIIRYGVKISESSTPTRYDLNQDIVREDLAKKLKERDNLIKLACKREDPVYDEDGALVPKVQVIPGKTNYKVTLL